MECTDEFKRRIYLQDPKTNTTKEVLDDGSYIIKGEEVVGQVQVETGVNITAAIMNATSSIGNIGNLTLGNQTLSGNHQIGGNVTTDMQIKTDSSVKGRAEPVAIYLSRYFFIIICFMILIFLLMMVMLLLIYYCMSTSIKI